jgi:hypothetical protein
MVWRMTNTSSVPRRVLNRALVGIWHQKRSLVFGGGVVAALVGYLTFGAPTLANNASTASAAAAATPDCADAVMAAMVGHGTPTVQQQAYQCMDPALQQQVFQQGFASQYRTLASAAVNKVSRVGTHDSEAGAELVYYAVDAGEQSVGFVVHLSPDGKVTMIS